MSSQERSPGHQLAASWRPSLSLEGPFTKPVLLMRAKIAANNRTEVEAECACLGSIIAVTILSALFPICAWIICATLAHMIGLRAHGQMVHAACRHGAAAENRPIPDGQSSAGCGAVGARDICEAQRGQPECSRAAGGQAVFILWLLQRTGLAMAASSPCCLLMT